MQKLEDKKREAEKIQNDSVSYFAIAKDLQSVHYMMDKSVEEYNLKQSVFVHLTIGHYTAYL